MCKNEGDKARSRVLPPPPPPPPHSPSKIPYLFQASLRREQNGEEGLFEGGGGVYWNIQKKVSILQKELELELVK